MLTPAARNELARLKADPIYFVRVMFDVEPDAWQADALMASEKYQRVALLASKGCGKTTVMAWDLLRFLFTRPHANIIAVSISSDNLRDGLWKESAKWLQRSPILASEFEWQKERIISKTHPSTWYAAARGFAQSADPQQQANVLAGFHGDHVKFIIDEAGSLPMALMATAEAALSSGIEAKLLIGGNPTSLDGPLYHAAVTHAGAWHVIKVTGDPDDPKRSPRVDAAWAREQVAMYGRENDWVRVNVFAEFPRQSSNSLLAPDDVHAAMRRHLREDEFGWAQKRLGVDVARFGDDRTVLFPRQGLAAFRPRVMRHERGSSVSTDIAAAVLTAKARWHAEVELFDATGGWAAGAVDVLRASGYYPVSLQFHAPADDARFANRRAEMWWRMAEWVKGGGALPSIPELVGELTAPTYTFVNGKFQLEPKDQVKARLGRSPDLADALALTFGLVDMPADVVQRMSRHDSSHALTDFDPFSR